MEIAIVIQARLGSSRLPNKIILPINKENETFLDILLSKLKKNFKNIPIILATSNEPQNNVLESFSKKHDILFYRGEEHNVLKRYVDCAAKYQINTIIRVCSDNPFLDIDLLKKMIKNYQNQDYFSYSINGKPSILTHYGFFAEIVKTDALKKVLKNNNPSCFEHVTNCIYTNENEFNINFIPKVIDEKYIRCTLDTEEDFNNLKDIYHNWFLTSTKTDYKALINYLTDRKELIDSMKSQVLKNSK